MEFRNPTNGYVEEVNPAETFILTLFFGPIYFAINGIWTHFVGGIIIATITFGISWLVYPFFAFSIVKESYLKKGWIEFDEKNESYIKKPGKIELPEKNIKCPHCGALMNESFTWCRNCNKPLPKHLVTPEERECPFCAELIKAKAIKCKHCGSEVNPLQEKERTVAKKVIQETQVSKSEPIKVKPIKNEKPESRPLKKEFSFPKKELVFVLIILGGGLSFAAYTQFTHDQNESSTPKAQVIDTTKELIDRTRALVSEEKYEEAIQYIDKQDWNSELAKLKTSSRIMLARKNIHRLEPLVHNDRKANDIKLLYANYLELASLDYKNTDIQAFNRAERMRNTIVEKELLADVKKVPSSDIEKNVKFYKELAGLNPRSTLYKEKLAYYEKKLEAAKPESCYSLGYRGGICAGKSMVGVACDPQNDIVLPVRCRNKDETARGMKAGIKYAYDSLGVPYQ
ncbi:zinc ribbon domain-containing protein [Desulfovibrio sp. Huiquan2017]|uniref:zinc ribbon domain-containing protein n=1 Tax=Desulfovibrio sp. Huiquan2017 TaxID=2816861 RepID=UPI001A9191DD|nr:zinc ribbon domain-containing protein [Desulfovibrio sp. Huiquan2017]